MLQQERNTNIPQADRWSFFWLVLSAVLGLFSFGYWVIPLAAWLTTVFTIRFLRTQPVWRGFTLMVIVSIAVNAYAGRDLVPMPFPMSIGLLAVQVLLGSLPFLADRLLAPRIQGFAVTLVFPLAATAWEFLNLTNSPLGSFGSAAYANYGNLPLMQLASVTGIWGITFLMHWFATVANWSWERAFEPKVIWRGVAVYATIIVLVLAYGNARLLFAPQGTPKSVRMAGITIAPKPLSELIPLYEQDLTAFRAETRTIHEQYFAATKREAQAGAQLVNWPEGAGIGIAEDVDALVAQGQIVAQQAGIYLAMPTFKLFAGEERPAENRLFVIDPTGKVIIDHIKYGGNFLEGTLLGNGVLQTVATPFGLLSGVICWDADFVTNMRQAGQQGVDLIVIGANDWPGINAVHAQMAVFRAIENGTTILRQASNGTSLAVDPYGRVLSSFDHFTTTDRVLVAQVPVNAHVFTLYTVIGDAFGWLTVVGFMVVSVWAVMKGRKAGRTPSLAVEQPVTAYNSKIT
jgi:apolipoprotein N-acyltransferase